MKITSRLAFTIFSAALTFLAAEPALAQAPGSIDSTYDPNADNGVFSVAVQPDGKTIIADGFNNVGGAAHAKIARLNADGSVDSTFTAGADGVIFSVAVQADGKILLGGNFTTVNGTARSRIARLNSNGTLDGSFDPNPILVSNPANTVITNMVVQTDGKILFAGSFTTVQPNGVPSPTTRNHIARVNSDGSVDTGFDPNANSDVSTVTVQADGKILIGGFFNFVAGTFRNKIARLNSNGSIDPGFNPNPLDGYVLTVVVQADGKILLGGGFTTLQPNGAPSPTTRNHIARVNSDGSLDLGFDPNTDGQLDSIVVQADGRILLSGEFNTLQPNGAASPTTRNKIARINSDGSVDTGFDPNADNTVYGIAVQGDGKVLLGGGFSQLQPNGDPTPTTRNHIARLNNDNAPQSLSAPDATRVQWMRGGAAPEVEQVTFELSIDAGGTWTPLGSGTRITGGWELTGLSLPASGSLRASGRTTGGYENGGSGLIQQVDDFGPAGSLAATYNPDVTSGAGYVLATAVQPDGKTIIGGQFTMVGGAAHANIARLNVDGSVDASFSASTNGDVGSVAVQADGKVVLGGLFTSVNGTAGINRITRLQADGTLDAGFNPGGAGADGQVRSVAVQADGKLVLGGEFTSVNGTTVGHIARLNTDGTLEAAFNSGGAGANDRVFSVAVQADGKLMLGGDFTSVNGTTNINRIARLRADGTLDTAFNAGGAGADGIVMTVALLEGIGKLVLGGFFTSVNGTAANHIARLQTDGRLDTGFNVGGAGTDSFVRNVAVQTDGKLVIGGDYTSVNGTAAGHVARLQTNGTLDAGFNAGGAGANDIVETVALQVDGNVLVGGHFTSVNGTPRTLLARLNNNVATQSLAAPDATKIQWQRGGAGPEVSQVTFELSTNGPWITLGAGTRVPATSNWQLTGLSLPVSGSLRARGRTTNGFSNGGSGLMELVQGFVLPPTALTYSTNPATYTKGTAITDNTPSSGGGPVVSYSISAPLPTGLSFSTGTGIISGTPTVLSPATDYTVTATNSGGSTNTIVNIRVNDVPPSSLTYSVNPATYTKGTAITNNTPSSSGGAVVSYSISAPLPTGLSFSTSTGIISGTPTVLSPATDYTVTATNTGGFTTVLINITVNDVPPSSLTYSTNPATYTKGTAITNNTPSSSGGAVVSYGISSALPTGLSFNTSTGIISGTPTVLSPATDYTVTATNSGGFTTVIVNITVNDVPPSALTYSTNPATYTKGTAITNNTPSSAGGPVVSYSISAPLPTGLSFSTSTGIISGTPTVLSAATDYTVTATNTGGSTNKIVNIRVNDVPPSSLTYSANPATYTKGTAITNNTPSSAGGPVVSYSISAPLPTGLSFSTSTGVISGTPTVLSPATDYTITATNTGGSTNKIVNIRVNDVPPSSLTYSTNPATYTKGTTIANNTPSSGGGSVVSYSISAPLPTGLSFSASTGVISGTPTLVSPATDYTITATNTGGSTNKIVNVTVNDVAPSSLTYSTNPATYTKGTAITNNTPSNGGGAVVSYGVSPALPAGLSLSTSTGVISGTPTALSPATDYTVTATNTGGFTTVALNIKVNDVAPSALTYATNPAVYVVSTAISNNTPSSTGGAVISYSISPALPAGLSFNTSTGVISGTPTAVSLATDYTVTATNSGGSTNATVNITVRPGLVGNVSTRLPVGTGDNVLIEGFIVQGPAGSTKKILVRAIGPSLIPFGITDALANPDLEIHDATGAIIATDDDWKRTQLGGLITGDQAAAIAASQLAPSNDLESAIIADLAPGSYTAVVRGVNNTAGTGVVDAYDLSPSSPAKLANIATRGLIQPGDKLMIAGFIIQNGPVKAVVRAIGPSLIAFGIANALPDTTLQLRDQNGNVVVENDDWKIRSDGTSQQAELEATGLQPTDDREAAFVTTLQPGQYTAQVRGKPEQTGIGVVQVYFLQ